MTLGLLITTLTGFGLYFWAIGLWYLLFIPISFLLFFLSYYTSSVANKIKGRKSWQHYIIFLARIIVLLGLGGSLHFFELSNIDIAQTLILLNLIARILSYLADYQDGKSIFQFGYYIVIGRLLSHIYIQEGISYFRKIFGILRIMNMAIIAFFIFVIGIRKPIEKHMRYQLGISLIGSIIITIINKIDDFYIALLASSLILTITYYLIHKITKDRPPNDQQQKNISVRRILAGERITHYQKPFKQEFHKQVYDLIVNMPRLGKYALEGLNILLITTMIIIYINNIGKVVPTIHERLYRIIIATFIINVILLKRINYNSILQRFIVFAVVNFAIYVSLFSLSNGNISQIVRSAVLWNIFCAALIFYAPKIKIGEYFKKIDYIFWIITTILAMILNIALFNRTNLPGQLLFSIIFLYIGIQSITLFYATKHINRM